MARQKKVKLTKFEMEIMNYLWQHGPSPIREIQESYPEKNRPAYTTVQTIVYRLENKNSVRRVKKIGNAHIFEATISSQAAYSRLLDDVLGFFGGSIQPMMSYLVESGKISLSDVRELESAIKQHSSASNSTQKSAAKTSATNGRSKAKR